MLQEAAKRGSVTAQLDLADFYGGKYGEAYVDYEKMIDYLWQAASLDSRAMARIGYCYEKGIGLPKDEVLAYRWYRKAASGDHPPVEALLALGMCYLKGIGVEQSATRAFDYFVRAAAQPGSPAIADFNVAIAYLKGEGVPPDTTQAFLYFKKAAQKGFPKAMVMMARLWKAGKGCREDGSKLRPDPQQIFSLLQRAAAAKEPAAYPLLAECYETGFGTKKDPEKAQYYRQLCQPQK